MGKNKRNIVASDDRITESFRSGSLEAGQQSYLNQRVRFSLKYSRINKGSIIAVNDSNKLRALFKKLGRLEGMTIRELQGLPRENGLSIERQDSGNYVWMHEEFGANGFSNYYHLRVQQGNLFRVFGAVKDGLYYLLAFDPDGAINH